MKKIQGDKTNTQFAEDLGISKQYLGDIYSGRKTPSDTVSSRLGYEPRTETRYVPSGSDATQEANNERGAKPKAARTRKRHSR